MSDDPNAFTNYDPNAFTNVPPEYAPGATPAAANAARQRVQLPGIGLIIIGLLNLFMAAAPAIYGYEISTVPAAQLEEEIKKQNPKALEDLKAQGWTFEGVLNMLMIASFAMAGADLLASFVVIFGGIRMLALKNYGLAIVAAILAAIPGVSCSGCCVFGIIVGLWALVVLISSDVKAAFQ